MNVLRKFGIRTLAFVFMFCMCCMFFSCSGGREVSIRISDSYGNQWFFPPDIDELYDERDYTGKKWTLGISGWKLERHSRYGKSWIAPSGEGGRSFQVRMTYKNEDGKIIVTKSICERGEYCVNIYAERCDLWDSRTVLLYITVV